MELKYQFTPPRPVDPAAPPVLDGPSLFTVVREQWGLKLERAKGPLKWLWLRARSGRRKIRSAGPPGWHPPSFLLTATLFGFLKSVEQAPGIGARQRLHPVRLAFLDGIVGDRPLGAQHSASFFISACHMYSSFSPTYMKTHIFEIAWSLAVLGSHMYPGKAVTDKKY